VNGNGFFWGERRLVRECADAKEGFMSGSSDLSRLTRTDECPEFPKVVLIDNCSACNLRCSMCDHRNITRYRKIQQMPFSLYKKIIDEIAVENPSARVWLIFFGDPFLCGDMPERIRYAKDKGLQDVVLNSNGALMTRDKAKAYIDAGLDAIYVGIDAAREETYNKIRVGGDFKKTVSHVLAYRDLLLSGGNPRQKLFVQYVESEMNEGEVEEFKKFWRSENVNVKIRPKVSWANLISANNLKKNTEVVRRPCYWLMQTLNICADGRVAFCSVDVHCRVDCGSVLEKTIKELWTAGKLKAYREMHKNSKFDDLPDMCRNCSDWQSAYADIINTNGK
jgi:pyruvate-formate lyase-activating enzyme